MSYAIRSMRECADDAQAHAPAKFAAIAPLQLDAAAKWAAIALAEAATRQAAALERLAAALENLPKNTLDVSDAAIRIADKIRELRSEARDELAESVAIFGSGE